MKKRTKIIILTILLSIFIITRFFGLAIVSGNSMEPNFKDGNIVLLQMVYNLKRFDVVTIKTDDYGIVIKRVIGLPNETIEYKDDSLYVNGEFVEDTFGSGITNDFKITLNNDEYFCMGDNRQNSIDSRDLGPFKEKYIIAKSIRKEE